MQFAQDYTGGHTTEEGNGIPWQNFVFGGLPLSIQLTARAFQMTVSIKDGSGNQLNRVLALGTQGMGLRGVDLRGPLNKNPLDQI